MSHALLMTLYALLISVFFASLWREKRKDQIRLFCQIFFSLMVGALVLGWLMYPFPSGPPAPIP